MLPWYRDPPTAGKTAGFANSFRPCRHRWDETPTTATPRNMTGTDDERDRYCANRGGATGFIPAKRAGLMRPVGGPLEWPYCGCQVGQPGSSIQ